MEESETGFVCCRPQRQVKASAAETLCAIVMERNERVVKGGLGGQR